MQRMWMRALALAAVAAVGVMVVDDANAGHGKRRGGGCGSNGGYNGGGGYGGGYSDGYGYGGYYNGGNYASGGWRSGRGLFGRRGGSYARSYNYGGSYAPGYSAGYSAGGATNHFRHIKTVTTPIKTPEESAVKNSIPAVNPFRYGS